MTDNCRGTTDVVVPLCAEFERWTYYRSLGGTIHGN